MKKSIQHAMARVKTVMSCKGEGYVDSGVKILIAVVLGSLLLFALYTLFKNFILPKISGQIGTLFNTTPKADSTDVTGAVSIAAAA